MKYARELDSLPLHKRLGCICYRRWKKLGPIRHWKVFLGLEFLLRPCETNVKTLYKICKRFNKRFGTETDEFFTRLTKTFWGPSRETLRNNPHNINNESSVRGPRGDLHRTN